MQVTTRVVKTPFLSRKRICDIFVELIFPGIYSYISVNTAAARLVLAKNCYVKN